MSRPAASFILDSNGRVLRLEPHRLALDEIGPKAFHLLSAAAGSGLSIPRTLCVPASVVRAAIGFRPEHRTRVDSWLAAVGRPAQARGATSRLLEEAEALARGVERDVAEYFVTHPVPLDRIPLRGRLAVRSSGYEDSRTNPNAGGNRSRLNVTAADLPAALGFVAASLFDPTSLRQRAIAGGAAAARRSRFPGSIDEIEFGILVQELIGDPAQAEGGPVRLDDDALLAALDAMERAAELHGGAPIEIEMAMRTDAAAVSLVGNRPEPETGTGVLLEATAGIGQAVTGRAVVTRYECVRARGGWLVLEWRDAEGRPVDFRSGELFVTQVRPRPRRRVAARMERVQSGGEVRLRTPAQVLVGGRCPPGARLLVAFSLDEAWRRYLTMATDGAAVEPILVAVHRANRLSHPALMFETVGAVVVVVDAPQLPVLRALARRADRLRFTYDTRSGTLWAKDGRAGPAARFTSRTLGEPEVRSIGGAPRRPERLRSVPEPWRSAAAAAIRREAGEARVRAMLGDDAAVSFRRFAGALDALERAGSATEGPLDAWMRREPAPALGSAPPAAKWSAAWHLGRQLLAAGLLHRVAHSTVSRAFSRAEILEGGPLTRYVRPGVDPESLTHACGIRALLRASPWIDAPLLHQIDDAVAPLLGGAHTRWLSLVVALAERCDPGALVGLLTTIAAAGDPPRDFERALETYRRSSAELRRAVSVGDASAETLAALDGAAEELAGALLAVEALLDQTALPPDLSRNVYYDGVEAFDGFGKLHLSRVILEGRTALPRYLDHLRRWWGWLSATAPVRSHPLAPKVAALLDQHIPRILGGTIDPVPLMPITWSDVVAEPPIDVTAHQLHNVIHQFALSQLASFGVTGTLPLARRWLAAANGFRRENATIDRVTPRSLSIELRALGIHSSFAELTPRGWYFHFAETSIWGAGKNARLTILDALLRWFARDDSRLGCASYLDESPLESALHFTLDIQASGTAFVRRADAAFRHLVAFVDGLWELSGTPEEAARPFVTSLQRRGASRRLAEAAVAYRARIQDAVPPSDHARHAYRIFFSVLAEFYTAFAPLAGALDAGYPALRGRMLQLLAARRAHRFARRSSMFGLILCMRYPREVAEDLRAGTYPARLGRARARLHLLPLTVDSDAAAGAPRRRPTRASRRR